MKKGFTLIELLAVIVILAIIAVIAVPIVIDIIDESKKNSTLRSAEMYMDAVELAITSATLKEKNIQDRTYNILSTGNICLGYDKDNKCNDELTIEVKGETPKEGTITITDGNLSNVDLKISEKIIIKNSLEELVYKESILCIANTSKATAFVYKDGEPNQLDSYDANKVVGLLASDGNAFAPGVAYTCNFIDDSETNNMTFFVLSESEKNVTLIAGFNLKSTSEKTHTVAWSLDKNNHKDGPEDEQAITAKEALAERTSNWNRLDATQKATIKMPTVYQIADAVDQKFSGLSIRDLPKWLCSYTMEPVSYGFWTSTPYFDSSGSAWDVHYDGTVSAPNVGNESFYGVRPVITISKSNIVNK